MPRCKKNFVSGSIVVRFGNAENNLIMGKATFLDPRFKTKGFSSEDNLKKVTEKIQSEIVYLIKKAQSEGAEIKNDNITSETKNPLKETDDTQDIIWQDFDITIKSSNITKNSPTATAIAEINMYSEETNLNRKENPILWWSERQKIYPWLSILAKKYLSIVETSVPCERVFSKAGQMKLVHIP
ncbi:unnamed protein product [Acanthoscelides obtectus]|uniref:HAT C-terminal dimerisation domain-containing protein n=1 Tax=Acanthoscelides obtectus TaxID=200917 RepID=A0A9P0L990_ACAOB|nr:unnamed protein product [Acanthoscelides obtectus]CAK1651800.1 Zinc finger BED domain-containing protein 1 [Acanthoscelides obtectus]